MSLIIDMLKDVDNRRQRLELPPGLVKNGRTRISFNYTPQLKTMLVIIALLTMTTIIIVLARIKTVSHNVAIPAYHAVTKTNDVALPDKSAANIIINSVSFETKKDTFEIRMLLTGTALYQIEQSSNHRIKLTIENAKLQADLPTLVGDDMLVKSIQPVNIDNNIDFLIDLNKDTSLISANIQQENNNNELILVIGTHTEMNDNVSKSIISAPSSENIATTNSIKSPTEQSLTVAQYERAIKLSETGNPQAAVDIFMKLLQTYPDYHDARIAMAAIILNNGNTAEANKIIDDGLDIEPDYPPLLEIKSRILTSEGKTNEALLLLQSEHPDINESPDYYVLMAALLNRTEKYEEAVKLYQKLVQIKPHDSSLWFGLGVALDKLGKNNDAMEAYRKASIAGRLNAPALAFLQNRLQILQGENHAEN